MYSDDRATILTLSMADVVGGVLETGQHSFLLRGI